MPDNEALRPIESDEVYTHDGDTATYQARARAAASEYRSTQNPSNFTPAPSAPAADPEPAAEGDDISPTQSVKVSHYDGLSATHRSEAAAEATRFDGELSDYAEYYNDHIKQPGESDYEMPVSRVTPISVVDDGAEHPVGSNLVGDYDVASAGYTSISEDSVVVAGTRKTQYDAKMAAANAKFDALEEGNNSIASGFQRLQDQFDDKYSQTHAGTPSRANMSVYEAGDADLQAAADEVVAKLYNLYDKRTDPNGEYTSISEMFSGIEARIGQMNGNISSQIISVAEYDAMRDDMLAYMADGKVYTRFISERRSSYPEKFTNEYLRKCWDDLRSIYYGNS